MLAGAAVASVGLLFAFGLAGPFVLSALGVETLTIDTEGTLTFLFAFTDTPEKISYRMRLCHLIRRGSPCSDTVLVVKRPLTQFVALVAGDPRH